MQQTRNVLLNDTFNSLSCEAVCAFVRLWVHESVRSFVRFSLLYLLNEWRYCNKIDHN